MYDDLNTPGYIANLHKLFEKSQKGSAKDKEIFMSACNFIGLLNEDKKIWEKFKQSKSKISKEEIEKKIEERNIARKNNTDIGIGITGIAGPDGGTEKKPVGLVFVGIFYKNNLYIKRYNLTPDRITNRELTVTLCLNEIRKILRNS